MKVINELYIYEINGREVSESTYSEKAIKLTIESHAIDNTKVLIKFKDVEVTVAYSDLEKAIRNATNAGRF